MKNEKDVELIPYGGVGSVTGANFMLKTPTLTLLVDCGLEQGSEEASARNKEPFAYDASLVDVLLVTHAHLDHIGRIPKLVASGFSGRIYSTISTFEIARVMFEDALKIMGYHKEEKPLYTKDDVEKALNLWETVTYHTKFSLDQSVSCIAKDAGHILGSAMYELRVNNKKIVFTGDLGNTPTPLLRPTEEIADADYLVMESVYGDRNHEPKKERDEKLKEILQKTIARGGTVIIPAFSLERSQVLLYEINNLIEEGLIPSVPVFLDSPLAIKVTEIYKRHNKNFNADVQGEIAGGDDIFDFPKLSLVMSGRDSAHIDKEKGSKIILAGSGMSTGGRVLFHEKEYLPESKNTLILAGYQSLGTLGRKIQEGAKTVTIDDVEVAVRAEVVEILGYSSHKDMDHLVEFVSTTAQTLKKVFVVMGEPKSSLFLSQRLHDFLGVDALYPEAGKGYILS